MLLGRDNKSLVYERGRMKGDVLLTSQGVPGRFTSVGSVYGGASA